MKVSLFSGLTILSCCLLFSCAKYVELDDTLRTRVPMGNGTITSFVKINNGIPDAIGIEISRNALTGLSQSSHGMFMLSLDDSIKYMTPFDHIVVDWNPTGHMPQKIYDVPHFDIHFYTVNVAERLAIGTYDEDSIAFKRNPPKDHLPPTYVEAACEPAMGKHWVDTSAAEFKGNAFTNTFIYGTYNGRVNFFEPMIAKAFIDSGGNFDVTFPQPAMYSPDKNYFPTKYSGRKTAEGNYQVTLSGFRLRN